MADPKALAIRLRQEHDILQKLLSLAAEQRDCLIAGAADKLNDIITQQVALIQKLSKATARTAHMLVALNESEAEGAGEDIAICRQLHADVAKLADDLKRLGRINWALAKEAMRYTDFSISLLAGRSEAPAYSQHGKCPARTSPLLMNKTA